MIYQSKDWLMRQIEIMGRTLAKMLFNKDSTDYVIIDYLLHRDSDLIYGELLKLIGAGKLNEAENLLFEKINEEIEANPDKNDYLEVAIDFYSRLNNMSDKALEECDFDRSEIEDGLREVSEIYNVYLI